MRIEATCVDAFVIYESHGLDPVTVVLRDLGGCGLLIVECHGESWAHYWGAIGNGTLRKFVASCSPGYLVGKLWAAPNRRTRRRTEYLERIIGAVQAALAEDAT